VVFGVEKFCVNPQGGDQRTLTRYDGEQAVEDHEQKDLEVDPVETNPVEDERVVTRCSSIRAGLRVVTSVYLFRFSRFDRSKKSRRL
jgi:hypothetical protein